MYLICYLLALLLAWLTPRPEPLLARLASPKFAERERASKELEGRMTYALAVKLAVRPPKDAEARSRVSRVLADYFRPWDGTSVPYLDALNTVSLCSGPQPPVVTRYVGLARDRDLRMPGWWGEYRAATCLWVADLQRWLVPPCVIRFALCEMAWRSELYDALGSQNGVPIAKALEYRRMPGHPSTWVMTTVRGPDGTYRQELRPQEPPK